MPKITPDSLVSIILPVYNGENYLAESIDSCLRQSYTKMELIIVNDASNDNSLNIAEQFALNDNRIKIINNQSNLNLPKSLNEGHKVAKGEFITWTSHDNFYEPEAISVLLDQILISQADIVYSNLYIVGPQGERKRERFFHPQQSSLLLGNVVGASFLYRKEVNIRNGGYDSNLHLVEDFDFWLQASLHSRFHYVPKFLYNFRIHEKSLSSHIVHGPETNQIFHQRLECSYLKFLQFFLSLKAAGYSQLLAKLHQHKKIDVADFLSEFSQFHKEMKRISRRVDFFDLKSFLYDIDVRIRANIRDYPSNQNIKTLLVTFANRPKILFGYDRRNGLKLIRKCIF